MKITSIENVSKELYIELRKRRTAIIQRCHNPNSINYKYYGAKGITVCDEWKYSIKAFILWAINNGYKSYLEIDKDIGSKTLGIKPAIYSPETCSWITKEQNQDYKFDNFKYKRKKQLNPWTKKIYPSEPTMHEGREVLYYIVEFNEEDRQAQADRMSKLSRTNNPKKKVFCITNNKTYESISSASIELDIPKGNISKVVNGKVKSTKGYLFEFKY